MSLVVKLTWIYQNCIWLFQTIVQSTSYTAFLEHSIPRFVQYLRDGKIFFYSVHISLHRKLYSASSATSTCIFFVFTGEPHFVTEVPTQVHWHVNLQCPNVRMFSVNTILHTFPIVLTRRIVLINKSFFTQSVHDWPVRSSQTFNSFLSFTVRVTMYNKVVKQSFTVSLYVFDTFFFSNWENFYLRFCIVYLPMNILDLISRYVLSFHRPAWTCLQPFNAH